MLQSSQMLYLCRKLLSGCQSGWGLLLYANTPTFCCFTMSESLCQQAKWHSSDAVFPSHIVQHLQGGSWGIQDQVSHVIPLGLSKGLLWFGHSQNSSTGSRLGHILIRCLLHLYWRGAAVSVFVQNHLVQVVWFSMWLPQFSTSCDPNNYCQNSAFTSTYLHVQNRNFRTQVLNRTELVGTGCYWSVRHG